MNVSWNSRFSLAYLIACRATDTQLLAGVKNRWVTEKLPINQPADVAAMILQFADKTLNGKSVFVAGVKGIDTDFHRDALPLTVLGLV
ncbi:hypothetical protein SEUCBS139899_007062 [Sporothrix eucalyptigena]